MAEDERFFSTVYYSNFWYSRFYMPRLKDFDGNIAGHEIEQHKFQLRMLALFFPHIYIPRTHLVTFRKRTQQGINRSIFQDKDFGFLFEHGVLRISSLPGIDAKQDNERIIGRTEHAEHVVYPDDPKYLESIPITDVYEVDSISESKCNTISFPQFGEYLTEFHPELAAKFSEAVKRANTPDLPFFHEDFLGALKSELQGSDFENIWRETNSIYLTTGGFGHDEIIAFFNEELESHHRRFDPYNIDRLLFSPSALYQFATILFSSEEISNLLYGDIEKVLAFIKPEHQYNPQIRKFQIDFQRLARNISRVTRPMRVAQTTDLLIVATMFDLELNDRFRRDTKLLSALLEDADKLSRAADLDAGLIMGSARAGLRYGQTILQRLSLRRRYLGIAELIPLLKAQLR